MAFVANYDVTIKGKTYEKGKQYDELPKGASDLTNPYGKEFFSEVKEQKEKKAPANAKADDKTPAPVVPATPEVEKAPANAPATTDAK
jgi:hypothetical protein